MATNQKMERELKEVEGELKREKAELPKRQHRGDYKDPDYPFRIIPEPF